MDGEKGPSHACHSLGLAINFNVQIIRGAKMCLISYENCGLCNNTNNNNNNNNNNNKIKK
jgi:hypothetical protein